MTYVRRLETEVLGVARGGRRGRDPGNPALGRRNRRRAQLVSDQRAGRRDVHSNRLPDHAFRRCDGQRSDDRHRDGDPKRDTDSPGRPASRVLPRRCVPAHRLPKRLHVDSPERPFRRRLAHARGGIAHARRLHHGPRQHQPHVPERRDAAAGEHEPFHADAGNGPGTRAADRGGGGRRRRRRRTGRDRRRQPDPVLEPEPVPLPRRRLREGLDAGVLQLVSTRARSTGGSARSPTRPSATTSTRRRRRPATSTTGTTSRTTTASTPAPGISSASTRRASSARPSRGARSTTGCRPTWPSTASPARSSTTTTPSSTSARRATPRASTPSGR